MEAMKGRQQQGQGQAGGNNRPTVRPQQMTPQEIHESQSPQDDFSPDEAESGKKEKNGEGERCQVLETKS